MIGVCKKKDEIVDLNNMGLGKALAALKRMKATGTGLYADQSFTQQITSSEKPFKERNP